MADTITIRRPDDWHVHLRDGAMLAAVLPLHGAAIRPRDRHAEPGAAGDRRSPPRSPIASGSLAALPAGLEFTPLMTAYLTDAHRSGRDRPRLSSKASSPRSSSTRRTRRPIRRMASPIIDRVMPVLERMAAIGMPLLVHGEATDPEVDVFDREAVFIDKTLDPLRRRLPELRIVLEHITTEEAVDYVESGRPEPRGDDHRASPDHQPQRHLPGRHPPASLLSADRQAREASPGAAPCRDLGHLAVSFSAPTARRTRSRPRRPPAAAPASSPRRARSNFTPRSSTRKARSTGSRPSRR